MTQFKHLCVRLEGITLVLQITLKNKRAMSNVANESSRENHSSFVMLYFFVTLKFV